MRRGLASLAAWIITVASIVRFSARWAPCIARLVDHHRAVDHGPDHHHRAGTCSAVPTTTGRGSLARTAATAGLNGGCGGVGERRTPSQQLFHVVGGQPLSNADSFACNTPTPQCDMHCKLCANSPVAINSFHVFLLFSNRVRRCNLRGGFSCRWVAVHAAMACRDGDSHLSAGRTSLSPAITSTLFAQTSDRRAPSPRVGACHPSVDAHPATEGMPRGSHCSRAHAH